MLARAEPPSAHRLVYALRRTQETSPEEQHTVGPWYSPLPPPQRSPVLAHTALFLGVSARSVWPSLALSEVEPAEGTQALK